MIEHSILHPTMTDAGLIRECEIAKKFDVASVCVKPYAVKKAVELLKGSEVLVGSVIGFPAGNSAIGVKVFEAETACKDGAVEIDKVINIVKVIFETDYVKTSSGFGFVKQANGDFNYQGATIAVKEAGCTRSGATATSAILEDAAKRFGK